MNFVNFYVVILRGFDILIFVSMYIAVITC